MAGETAPANSSFDQNFNKLEEKMSKTEVQKLLGAPDLRELKNGRELWHYAPDKSKNFSRVVIFVKSRLISFAQENSSVQSAGGGAGADAAASSASATSTKPSSSGVPASNSANPIPALAPAPHSLKIGEECTHDKDCAGDNCHLHTCAGKNNCRVPPGGICATNADCCGSICDFNVCK